ncbi:MAG: glycoside hydrolase family 3 N-terminal domain-containing protein, partial [Gemmiger qucibialis]
MDKKVQDILSKMTLEDKISLCNGADFWHSKAMAQYGIPAVTMSDGPHGVRCQKNGADMLGVNESEPATCFPTAVTSGATWDAELLKAEGQAIGEEGLSYGVDVVLGPGVNIKRNPLCGRNFEYFSEDPYLSGKMAASYVRGIQSNGISACPKHFAVNSQELRRMASDSVVDERTLRELYLTGFEIVVKEAKPKTIMSSYNLINGTYANENRHLLMDILRGEWGFDGAVVTDWGGSNDHALGVQNGSTL